MFIVSYSDFTLICGLFLQRVSEASVTVGAEVIGTIGEGLLIFLGVSKMDGEKEAAVLVDKIVNLRVFDDSDGKMNESLADIEGDLLVVSQFTLLGDARKGRRPSYIKAAAPEKANALYEFFIREAKKQVKRVETGEFQATMHVSLINDGPVTILLDTDKTF